MTLRAFQYTATGYVTVCDECGKEADPHEAGWLRINWSDSGYHTVDLCPKHYEKFRKRVGK